MGERNMAPLHYFTNAFETLSVSVECGTYFACGRTVRFTLIWMYGMCTFKHQRIDNRLRRVAVDCSLGGSVGCGVQSGGVKLARWPQRTMGVERASGRIVVICLPDNYLGNNVDKRTEDTLCAIVYYATILLLFDVRRQAFTCERYDP